MKNVFIIGCKGIPAQYGGFETFVDKLTEKQKSKDIKYHVACMGDEEKEFTYNNARCFTIKVPNVGASKAVIYDIEALKKSIKYVKENNIEKPIFYILACRIGPFIGKYKNEIRSLGGQLFVNPDGHEWKRAKWNKAVRKYWKHSERLMVKNADLLVCDSKNIEKYILEEYKEFNPKTTFIAYGADREDLHCPEEKLQKWYKDKGIRKNEYFLIVGRFVPENNYETMIREFMKSNTKKDLVLITNIEKNKFYEELRNSTGFHRDDRIKFVGTVYDGELLQSIRENAFAYIHGHEVGGTNPSLLEALATTNVNLLLGVGFNKEVGLDSCMYFTKEENSLSNLIDKAEELDEETIKSMGEKAKNRISTEYCWEKIVEKYETLFLNF